MGDLGKAGYCITCVLIHFYRRLEENCQRRFHRALFTSKQLCISHLVESDISCLNYIAQRPLDVLLGWLGIFGNRTRAAGFQLRKVASGCRVAKRMGHLRGKIVSIRAFVEGKGMELRA